MATQITDHGARALARLKHQFKDKPKIESFLNALTAQGQELETALFALLTERGIDDAVGVQLDALGDIVGQPRNGLDDDDYRRFVRARIATNKSRGTVAEILKVARLVIDDDAAAFELELQPPAAVVLRLADIVVSDDLADILIGFLRDVSAAGVRMILEYPTVADDLLLYLDIDNLDDEQMIPAIE